VDARLSLDEIAATIRVRVAELLSGLPLQQLAQAPAAEAPPVNGVAVEGLHHPHAQTGSTPHLHP
jgi:dTMP kinase